MNPVKTQHDVTYFGPRFPRDAYLDKPYTFDLFCARVVDFKDRGSQTAMLTRWCYLTTRIEKGGSDWEMFTIAGR